MVSGGQRSDQMRTLLQTSLNEKSKFRIELLATLITTVNANAYKAVIPRER